MDSLDALPMAAGLTLHAAGLLVACLIRLPLGFAGSFLLRVTFLALGVLICGLAIESALHGFEHWAFSGLTLGAMVIMGVLHSSHDETPDPVLAKVVAAKQ
jgi:hypothetical protein